MDEVRYDNYLQLDKILDSQRPCSKTSDGKQDFVHDELLFIITHQAFELWFKQILFELDDVLGKFSSGNLSDKDLSLVEQRLSRVEQIQELLLTQFASLETMTAQDFLDFRDFLIPASGFQSFQFRLIESKMGLLFSQRSQSKEYLLSAFESNQIKRLEQVLAQPSLFDHVQAWLERMPFLVHGQYAFLHDYQISVKRMLENERKRISQSPRSPMVQDIELHQLQQNESNFESLFDEKKYQDLIKEGKRRLSRSALLSALFIHLYRSYAIFHLPFRVLQLIVAIDENWERWRARHFRMIRKMIGKKIGTGGSSGHDYLRSTIDQHRVFSDFDQIPTYLLPGRYIPELPSELKSKLGFSWE
ncbi:MAG: tryptophan 2,3-dioxygenase family protein [Bdellovibrionota bacterium]